MDEAFSKLGLGLVIAIFLVYLLMVVLFQSWMDPFIVMVCDSRRTRRHSLDAGSHRDDDQR